jgi:hypothetical protein
MTTDILPGIIISEATFLKPQTSILRFFKASFLELLAYSYEVPVPEI